MGCFHYLLIIETYLYCIVALFSFSCTLHDTELRVYWKTWLIWINNLWPPPSVLERKHFMFTPDVLGSLSVQQKNEMNHGESFKPLWKDPCFSSTHFNWPWTNYVVPSQVATADGLIQRAVSIRGQGGLLLGMDPPLLGSLPAWVPPRLPGGGGGGGANGANKVARFQAGVADTIRQTGCCNAKGSGKQTHTHTHMHVVTTET